jgi:N utilization substance protein A
MRGQRVKNVVRELQGEKIDIVRWSDDPVSYIKNALSPAILSEVNLDREKMRADVLVEDDQLSLAIGKKGQNVRLASRLTGWQIDVRSKSQRVPLSQLEGVDENIEGLLKRAGIHSIKDILKSTVEDLVKIEGISAECAEKIIQEAHRVILEKDQTPLSTALDEAVADQVAEVAPQEATEEAPKKEPKKAKKKDKKPKETKETSAETQEE